MKQWNVKSIAMTLNYIIIDDHKIHYLIEEINGILPLIF